MKSFKRRVVQDIAIIRSEIRRELIKPRYYLSTKVPLAYKDCQKAIDTFRQSLMKELEAISPVIESSRNVILEDLR